MHKWFWYSLNPEEKFQRYKHSLWLLILAIIVLFIKFDLMIALGYSLVLIIFSYLGYKHFQREAMAYKERKSCHKTFITSFDNFLK